MSQSSSIEIKDPTTLQLVRRTLWQVSVELPYLSGLARIVRPVLTTQIPTAAVFASGRMLVNPEFINSLERSEATFVLAHELLHLALRSHDRQPGTDPYMFNVAHDYIINDMLREELRRPIPAGGLDWEGCRRRSVEQVLADLKKNPDMVPSRVWYAKQGSGGMGGPQTEMGRILQRAYEDAGLGQGDASKPQEGQGQGEGDILNEDLERQWFPEVTAQEQKRQKLEIKNVATKANSTGVWMDRVSKMWDNDKSKGFGSGNEGQLTAAMEGTFAPPWEVALQRWMDAVAPGERTFARPSRRGADRTDIVLPGRKREGWTLHIVLDTSGSMTTELSLVLGTIAGFCENVGVQDVRIVQCDTAVTQDEVISPQELSEYEIRGFGGSDLTPGMLHLADDDEVESAIVITDGYIDYPGESMPYNVLWVLTPDGDPGYFNPPYGKVIQMTMS